jgi:hypothetical protein
VRANNLAENARDADEQEQDDVLDLDQTELDEQGLTLDDPHQPESDEPLIATLDSRHARPASRHSARVSVAGPIASCREETPG